MAAAGAQSSACIRHLPKPSVYRIACFEPVCTRDRGSVCKQTVVYCLS